LKKALITGITGQDGSYLAELFDNIYQDPHIDDYRFILHYGDMTDSSNLNRIVEKVNPNEIYNLAAQSHVKVSFDVPEYSAEVDAIGTLRVLDAIKEREIKCKFYQASSSEMFGRAKEFPQNENTRFNPSSPYAASKVFSYWVTSQYREAYDMHASNGILFNHECVTEDTPIIINKDGFVDIIPIEELVPHRKDLYHSKKVTTEIKNGKVRYNNAWHAIDVWDGDKWTKIKTMTATSNIKSTRRETPKKVIAVTSRGGYYEATPEHISFLKGGKEIETQKLKEGDKLELKEFPKLTRKISMTGDEAEFLGMIVADGHISNRKIQFTNNDKKLRKRISVLWKKISGGSIKETIGRSGFSEEKVHQIILSGNSEYIKLIRREIYTEKNYKRIPLRILNSKKAIIKKFLYGYNRCDGLKAGNQKSELKSFTTNSTVLALGLWYLVNNVLGLRITLHPEIRKKKIYFHLNINSDNNTTGQHLKKSLNEIKKISTSEYIGWLFDLETKSKTYSAGIGLTWIHNSPRRGETFVTRKITLAASRIYYNQQDKLYLGNLNSQRDWGYAPEYVEAMWMMLQQKKPDDYIIATNSEHSIREFCEIAFNEIGINIEWQGKGIKEKGIDTRNKKSLIEVDPFYFRPLDVERLCGDYSKAEKNLGWKPKTSFKQLVKMMMKSDLEFVKK
jgi:GDPmannose 4,6-dehydratase